MGKDVKICVQQVGEENAVELGSGRGGGSVRDATSRGQNSSMESLEDALECDRVGADGSRVGPGGLELTWCYECNTSAVP